MLLKMPQTAFSQLLSETLRATRVTQSDLATKVGSTQSYISQLARGDKKPSASLVKALADALKADTDAFLLAAGFAPETAVPSGPVLHVPELAGLTPTQVKQVEAKAREAAAAEVERIKRTASSATIAQVLEELPEDMEHPPTAKELKLLARINGFDGSELDPRSGSYIWAMEPDKRWPALRQAEKDWAEANGAAPGKETSA